MPASAQSSRQLEARCQQLIDFFDYYTNSRREHLDRCYLLAAAHCIRRRYGYKGRFSMVPTQRVVTHYDEARRRFDASIEVIP